MAKPASVDLRKRVVESYLLGDGTYEEIAGRFRVGTASVSRWLRVYRETGGVQPKPHGGGMPAKLDATALQWLAQLVEKKPDITLLELAVLYQGRSGTTIALSIMCRAMKKLGLVRKKR